MYIEDFMEEFTAGKRGIRFSDRKERSDFLRFIDLQGIPIYDGTRRYINNPMADGDRWWHVLGMKSGFVEGIGAGAPLAKNAVPYRELELDGGGIYTPDEEEFSAAFTSLFH